MRRMLLVPLVLVSVGCNSGPPCHRDSVACECWEGIPEPYTDTCSIDDFGGAAACCRSPSYPDEDGYCSCGSIYCLAADEDDSLAYCSCGFLPDGTAPVQQCTGVCCLNTVDGHCYCTNGSGGGCRPGDTPTTTCSADSLASSGACPDGFPQVTSCDP